MSQHNLSHAENAFLSARAKHLTWYAEWQRMFFAPLGANLVAAMVGQMTEEQKEMMREMNPQLYDAVMQTLTEV